MYSVLIVDDESIERTFLSRMLNRHRDRYYVLGEAANGAEAIRLSKSERPDIIIMDISMPGISGLEAAERIRAETPGQIIILNSAYAEFEFAQKAIEYRIDAYLIKPSSAAEILSTMESCLRKHKLDNYDVSNTRRVSRMSEHYPFRETDVLLAAISLHDKAGVTSAAASLTSFFHAHKYNPDEYKLYVLNMFFSIGRALKQYLYPQEYIDGMEYSECIARIDTCTDGEDLKLCIAEFFSRLTLLMDKTDGNRNSNLDRIACYIDTHFGENLTLNDLAKVAFMNPAYLSRRFHQQQGMSVRDFIASRRMERAKQLLQYSEQSIKEIAIACGFANISHFHRAFKKTTGTTPGEFRKAATCK